MYMLKPSDAMTLCNDILPKTTKPSYLGKWEPVKERLFLWEGSYLTSFYIHLYHTRSFHMVPISTEGNW